MIIMTMDQERELDITYTFNVTESTSPDYRCSKSVINWIKSNLEGLTDDKGNTIFSKVNYGYNEDTLKGFGKKPVADVYINNIEYSSTLYDNTPRKVHSIIICYLKGKMNNTYEKACELTDFLIQEFEETNSFRELATIVRNTDVSNVEIQVIPNGKTYGVICAFELEHELY